ncbi:MAG: Uma2 family endonuclease [bacterium]|nr:Uma2 family endonuclease [bacterium]
MITLPIRTDATAPIVRGARQGEWTYAAWELLGADEYRYEIIDGALYMTTAPSSFHQWIVMQLLRLYGVPALERKLGFAYIAPIGVIMPGCDPVQPDFVFVRAANAGIIRDKRIFGVPDMIAEVMSPGSAAYDTVVKKEAYQAAGVPEYAVIDPGARQVSLYTLTPDRAYGDPAVLRESDLIRFAALPAIESPVGALYAGSPDTTL